MSNSIPIGHALCKYYIEDNQLKVIEGVLENRNGRKFVTFGSKEVPDESFPGYRNIERVWKGGEVLWLTERDDALAKKLFTAYHVGVIKDLQKQIDDIAERIGMIRSAKVKNGTCKRVSKCFGEVAKRSKSNGTQECDRAYKETWDASEFVNADQYAERKINMLKQEMFIDISYEDEKHIRGLNTREAIDASVRAMINKYWPV